MNKKERENKEIEQSLGRTDYFDFWLTEAEHHIRRTGLFSGSMSEVLNIYQSAFGKDWLLEEIKASKPPGFPNDTTNELASWIMTPGPRQVLSVIETCVYLRYLMNAPNIEEVISMLKAGQFETTFMQLAFGYRFQRLGGINPNLRFEPESTDGRKGDIAFVYEGEPYVVECYVPKDQDAGMPWFAEILNFTGNKLLEKATQLNRRVTIHMDFGDIDTFSPQDRKILEKHCLRLITECELGKSLKDKTDIYSIQVVETSGYTDQKYEDLLKTFQDDSTCGMQANEVPRNQLRDIMRGIEVDKKPGSAIFIKTNDRLPELSEVVEKLANKLEKKVVQLRQEEPGVKGLLLVGSYYGRPTDQNRMQHFERVKQKVLDRHKNVSGILIVDRVTEPSGLSLYVGTFIHEDADPTTTRLLWKLSVLENQRDILTDWP